MTVMHIITVTLIAGGLWACQPASTTSSSQPLTQDITAPMIIKKSSPFSAGETIDRLENILTSKGLTVFTRVNHAAQRPYKTATILAKIQVLSQR